MTLWYTKSKGIQVYCQSEQSSYDVFKKIYICISLDSGFRMYRWERAKVREMHIQRGEKKKRERDTDMWLDPSGPALFQSASENRCINQPSGKCVTFQRVTNFIKEKWCCSLTLCASRINGGPERLHSLRCKSPPSCCGNWRCLSKPLFFTGANTSRHNGHIRPCWQTNTLAECSPVLLTSPFVQRQQRSAQSAQAHV